MKSIYNFLGLIIVLIFFQNNLMAQEAKDTTVLVNGVCNMCKMTIETASYLDGVTNANWDLQSKVLTLTYNTDVVSLEDINKSINKAGYDTEYTAANTQAYQALNKCCHYRDPEVVKDHQ